MERFRDGCYEVRPHDCCSLCGEEYLVDDNPLLLVESGVMEPMKRDPNFLRFKPDHNNEDDLLAMDEAAVILYHADCLITRVMDKDWGSHSPSGCDLCGNRFLDDIPRWAFRLRIGSTDFETGIFVADDSANCESIICASCFGKEIKVQMGDAEFLQTG